MPDQERCMCGDPSCSRCFPYHIEEDEDEAYITSEQREVWTAEEEFNKAQEMAEALSEEPGSASPVER